MKSIIITLLTILVKLINSNTTDSELEFDTFIVENDEVTDEIVGKVWPEPLLYEPRSGYYYFIDPDNFKFLVVGKTCDILEEALGRYKIIIKLTAHSLINDDIEDEFHESKLIRNILVDLTYSCERYPHLNMDESYDLESHGRIFANSIWGILRALETYSQLLIPNSNGILQIPDFHINDRPRFPHRGLMLDTARHYIKIETILTILDGMAYNKLNVFHWHIVDDESFPYESIKFPELSAKGAYSPSLIYSKKNISYIIEYARMRGIRVIPEFEILGHKRSLEISHPEILTECENKNSKKMGPINPISEIAYDFLQDLFSEVLSIFQDQFIHLGDNKIDCDCWKSNKQISQYISLNTLACEHLQKIYIERITNMLFDNFFTPIAWQEAIDGNNYMPKDTIVQIWFGDWRNLLKKFSASGRRVILSACWYNFSSSDINWKDDYNCDPYDVPMTKEEIKFIIGGEACIWTKYIGNSNVLQKIFPRISAIAEKLWSNGKTNNIFTQKRLEEHTCRMLLRGIPAMPLTESGIC